MECVQRTMRKFQNQFQTNLHKDHLVCLVARMQFLNSQCNDNAMKVCILLEIIYLSVVNHPEEAYSLLCPMRKTFNL